MSPVRLELGELPFLSISVTPSGFTSNAAEASALKSEQVRLYMEEIFFTPSRACVSSGFQLLPTGLRTDHRLQGAVSV